MTPLILIPLLYLITDYLSWRYNKTGPILFSELSKVASLLTCAACIWFGVWLTRTAQPGRYIIALVLFHFVIQQIGCGIIRQGNPLYLGTGLFDRFISFITGGTWYMYVLLLALATFIGIHLLITAE